MCELKKYPMRMLPVSKNIIWGGTKLVEKYHKQADFDKIAETWELTVRSDGMSVIGNGIYSGMTMDEYIKMAPDSVSDTFSGEDFPLLIKFIDACDTLSIQIHPDDEYAHSNNEGFGKTEMWYVVEAEPGAKLIMGLDRDYTKAEFRKAIDEKRLEDIVNTVEVKTGDSFFIPAGTVHAIGAGLLIAEIQQNSSTTYRVYDYNRRQKDGSFRQLHIDQAVDVLQNRTKEEMEQIRFVKNPAAVKEENILAACDYFTVEHVEVNSETVLSADEKSFLSVLCLDGEGKICSENDAYPIQKGDSYYIPAGLGNFKIAGQAEFLISSL